MSFDSDNMPENIVLVGPMGSGKTTIGRRLAALLDKQFIDCDQALEQHLGVNIALIFDLEGEHGFRKREQQLIKDLCQSRNTVLATGGGSVLAVENRDQLTKFGLVIYLRTSVNQQLSRLQKDKTRPLLQRPDREQHLHKLAQQRDPIYTAMADVTVQAQDLSVDQMALHTLATLRKHINSSKCTA